MISTIIVSIILLAIVSTIVIHLVRKKKRGKGSCGCGCDSCGMSKYCHKD